MYFDPPLLTILYLALLATMSLSYLALMEAIGKRPKEGKIRTLLRVTIATSLLSSAALMLYTTQVYLPLLANIPALKATVLTYGKSFLDALTLITPAVALGALYLEQHQAEKRHRFFVLSILALLPIASTLGLTYILGTLLLAH